MRGDEMSRIYEWVRSLVFYLILMTMVVNLLPDKKYEKYLQLFVGMVFLMLILSPFANLSGAEAQVAEAFSRLTFQNDAKMLRREIEDAEGARMEKLVEQYRDAIEMDIRRMAEEVGVECRNVEIVVDEEMDGGTFGRVIFVEMTVSDVENCAELSGRIGAYYGLKEGDIAIDLEDE